MNNLLQFIYLITAFILIVGLRQMSSPKTAKHGITIAGVGMLGAIIITFFSPQIHGFSNYAIMIIAIALGTFIGWYSGNKVQMISMPQMIALYNGMGGGAAGAIAVIELLNHHELTFAMSTLSILGAIIGTISFSGSIIAFAKLQDLMKRVVILPKHQAINMILLVSSLVLGALLLFMPKATFLMIPFFALLLLLGITFTIPIGGANMPIVISLFNAMTGLAVGFNGFALHNYALIIAGTVVGASGTLLTQLMAKAMNKSVSSILFSPLSATTQQVEEDNGGSLKPIEQSDAAVMMAYSKKVIIVPGYGMAVAQAQHKIWELAQQLEQKGVTVKFAIHPVAGRMPGHMNVLLAEAGVPYDKLFDLEEINAEFSNTDTVLVIGANDVVNPSAKTHPESPIYGMPILDVNHAQNILVIKRGQGKGFSGVENSLFTLDNTRMLYGDGQEVVNKLVQSVKGL
ncbi:NAD(P)(+) transhydrogenase (Re/Si-specific) subunit beta [Candidatus Berkiella aquae]|uniref:NAD(P) transhydrogenase subunit beta n=1 Tax=Candidatus Berkiella aquae TaxID=295108 RepID=A0A0Q9YZG8_9GAMM|nr:NAD(P)(+) transhydrogenase (Re/Si-specific) subunit beta [Candidatus Berkiella aquae]MCS5712417.1 NAD(P)(+) transhydrogenase (Re/Si-specific) subunit beta [Candidatus Berkiella aquae]